MNTRRYPRTLQEAFPHSVEYACAVERPYDSQDRIVLKACAVAIVAVIVILAVWG